MKKVLIFTLTSLIIILLIVFSCSENESGESPAKYVDPFIGTDGSGHTYPGATTPFGMVQLSPDTGIEGARWASGYQSMDSIIIGFSHTHLSGAGIAELGDILFMPANGDILFTPGDGYSSRFSHANERAEAGYYSVSLDDYQTQVELTATQHTGLHRYTFSKEGPQHIIIDLTHGIGDISTEGYYRVVDSVTIEGYRKSSGRIENHTVYFRAQFSEPFSSVESMIDRAPSTEPEGQGTDITLAVMYNRNISDMEIQVGISTTSLSGAAANLAKERIGFDEAREAAFELWDKELRKIKVEGSSDVDKKIFYTALYHTMVALSTMSDVDGTYLGADGKIYQNHDDVVYGSFPLWKTSGTLHPLYTIIEPTRNQEFIRSILRYYDQMGHLPVWNMNETDQIPGCNAVSVIVDAYMKGQRDFDTKKALAAMVKCATRGEEENGVDYFSTLKFIPSDKTKNSVSKALEAAYNDWCIARMAHDMGEHDIYDVFIHRAQNYKNHFDPNDLFFKSRNAAGTLDSTLNPRTISKLGYGDFVNGNAWHYNFYIKNDINTHIAMNGGDDAYVERLEKMFATEGFDGSDSSEMHGIIGQYAHSNKTLHYVPYLYSYAGQPWKTQERITHIISEMYGPHRDGICGNEDYGQMSAWYIFSTMGFYPVTPGSNVYVIGTPLFTKTTIYLENGKKFIVEAHGLTNRTFYIKSIKYNGKQYNKSYITHDMIANGGKLVLTMSMEPNHQLGSEIADRPVARITDNVMSSEQLLRDVVFEPQFNREKRTFNKYLTLRPTANHPVHYTVKEGYVVRQGVVDDRGIVLSKNAIVELTAVSDQGKTGATISGKFYVSKMPERAKVTGTKPDLPHVSNGLGSLVDGMMGDESMYSPEWLGFYGNKPTICIELPYPQRIQKITVNTMNSPDELIFHPNLIEIRTTERGRLVGRYRIYDGNPYPKGINMYEVPVNVTTKRLYITLHGGHIPAWHINRGDQSWIFVDEIIIN